MNIIIVDYGLGNLYSLKNAFQYYGLHITSTQDVDIIQQADALILPGVGAFADGVARLKELNIGNAIRSFADGGGPILGICLGMQLLMDWSEEFGYHEGLGLIKGCVKSLRQFIDEKESNVKIPHIGWNDIQIKGKVNF